MKQPEPKVNSEVHIADLVVEEIKARKIKGLDTYGIALQPFNGRDATQDALEEALDLAHYIKQWQIERKELINFVQDVADVCYSSSFFQGRAKDLLKKLGVR